MQKNTNDILIKNSLAVISPVTIPNESPANTVNAPMTPATITTTIKFLMTEVDYFISNDCILKLSSKHNCVFKLFLFSLQVKNFGEDKVSAGC